MLAISIALLYLLYFAHYFCHGFFLSLPIYIINHNFILLTKQLIYYRFAGIRTETILLTQIIYGGRYTPAMYLLLEAFSEFILLLIVTLLSNSYDNKFAVKYYSILEIIIFIMYPARICYAFGRNSYATFHSINYFERFYNTMEFISLSAILIWMILIHYPSTFYLARVAITFSAIPLSLKMLQYLSTFKEVGVLVSIIIQTTADLRLFIGVYLVWLFGFTVFFHGLFDSHDSFSTPSNTFLYLFQSTLGNLEFSVFDSQPVYKHFGIAVYGSFLVFTTVLLLNLLIAQINLN